MTLVRRSASVDGVQLLASSVAVWASNILVFSLAYWLKIFPITLGGGKRLFADGTVPAAFKVPENTVTSKGAIIVNYERAGAVSTASL